MARARYPTAHPLPQTGRMADTILVAILRQGCFDVTQGDRTSLRFEPVGAQRSRPREGP